jgi:hypothetical protein
MKPDQVYQGLIELAEKLEITVKAQNLRKAGIHVKSGLCKVKEELFYIMDKHKSIRAKIDLISTCLAPMAHENIYVMPNIRELLNKKKAKLQKSKQDQPAALEDPNQKTTPAVIDGNSH